MLTILFQELMSNRSLMEQIAAGLLKYDLHEQVRREASEFV